MDLEFNLGWPGPQPEIPDWAGTITFNGVEYGMLFFAIDSGKPFEVDPGKVHFYGEIWAIYEPGSDLTTSLPSDDPADWDYWLPSNAPAELVLWGYDAGVVAWQNNKYRMNGNVEFANVTFADGAFAAWQDRNVHMSGVVEWQEIGTPEDPVIAPHHAPGTFRIN